MVPGVKQDHKDSILRYTAWFCFLLRQALCLHKNGSLGRVRLRMSLEFMSEGVSSTFSLPTSVLYKELDWSCLGFTYLWTSHCYLPATNYSNMFSKSVPSKQLEWYLQNKILTLLLKTFQQFPIALWSRQAIPYLATSSSLIWSLSTSLAHQVPLSHILSMFSLFSESTIILCSVSLG